MNPIKPALSLATLLAILAATSPAHADASRPGTADSAGEHLAFKLTPSFYATTNQRSATDTNLRANLGNHAVWLGYYQRGGEFRQTRSGYEYSADLPFGQLVPSLQIATHGFIGGSVNAEIGEAAFGGIYALLGLGRTNKKDYYNLNFDPNDSAVYGPELNPDNYLSTDLKAFAHGAEKQKATSKDGKTSNKQDLTAGAVSCKRYPWPQCLIDTELSS